MGMYITHIHKINIVVNLAKQPQETHSETERSRARIRVRASLVK